MDKPDDWGLDDNQAAEPSGRSPDPADAEIEMIRESLIQYGKDIGELIERVEGLEASLAEVKHMLARHSLILKKTITTLNLKPDA